MAFLFVLVVFSFVFPIVSLWDVRLTYKDFFKLTK